MNQRSALILNFKDAILVTEYIPLSGGPEMKTARILAATLISTLFAVSTASAQEKYDKKSKIPRCVIKSDLFARIDALTEEVVKTALNYGRKVDEKTMLQLKKDLLKVSLSIIEVSGGVVGDKAKDCPVGTRVVQ